MSLIRIADILFTGEKKLERNQPAAPTAFSHNCRSLYAEAIEVFMKPATFRLLEVDEEKIIGRIKNIVQQCCRFFRSECSKVFLVNLLQFQYHLESE